MRQRHRRLAGALLGCLCILAASCSVQASSHRQAGTSSSSASRSHNPPQIEYLLVLNSNGKPRTFFHPGDIVRFRLEVYSVLNSLGGAATSWRIGQAGTTVRRWSVSGGFTGPTRGNLFRMIQSETLPQNAAAGTYTVSAALALQGRHLTRTAQFYVRR